MSRNNNDFNEWANVSLMNDEDIDYSLIPEAVLQELALGNEFYIATSALVELWMRESSTSASIAWEILSTSHGDRYLQSTALGVLSNTDKEKTLNYISEKGADCDLLILNKMMKLMVDNSLDLVPTSTIIQTIIERLKNLRDEQELIEPDVQRDFMQLYNVSPPVARIEA